MKKDTKKLLIQIKKLIQQSHEQFDIDQDQTSQRVLFDTLLALQKSSHLLNTAWEISKKNEIEVGNLRDELVDTFSDFAKVQKNLKKELKYKH